MSIKLFQHNQEVYEALLANLITNNKVAVVQATGTGKGVIATKLIAEAFKDKNILIVAPTNAILTNYRENHIIDTDKVKLVSYTKISRLTEEELSNLSDNITVLILDEFHRTGAPIWGKVIDFLVNEMEKRHKKIIGLSATPVRYLDNARDMTEELFGGNVIYGVDLQEALEKNILPKFKYVVSLYGYAKEIEKVEEKLSQIKDERFLKKLQNPISRLKFIRQENERIKEVILKETEELGTNQKWIVFCNDIVEMAKVKKLVSLWFDKDISIFSVNSDTAEVENNRTLQEFNSKDEGCNVLLCVNMLNEGVHIKGISGVIMLRKTVSPIIFMQQLGRALAAGNNSFPIIFDFIGNYRKLDSYKENGFNDLQTVVTNINNGSNGETKNKRDEKIIIKNYVEDIVEVLSIITNALLSRRMWEDKEIKYITENCEDKTVKELAEYLNRPEETVSAKLKSLGLKAKLSDIYVTDKEKQYILNNYETKTISELGKYLNKSPSTIKNILKRNNLIAKLGVKKFSAEDIDYLKKYSAVKSISELAKEMDRHPGTLRSKIKQLGLPYYQVKNPLTDNDKQYILDNHFNKTILEMANTLNVSELIVFNVLKENGIKAKLTQRAFSEIEIEFLKENHTLMTAKEIANYLGRPVTSVRSKLKNLGLSFKIEQRYLTEEEKAYIESNYPKKSASKIAREINRGTTTVHDYLKNIGLKTEKTIKEFTESDVKFLYDNCSAMTGNEMAAVLHRPVGSVFSKLRELGLSSKPEEGKLTDDSIQYILDNYDKQKVRTIATELGVNTKTIYSFLNSQNINYKVKGRV